MGGLIIDDLAEERPIKCLSAQEEVVCWDNSQRSGRERLGKVDPMFRYYAVGFIDVGDGPKGESSLCGGLFGDVE